MDSASAETLSADEREKQLVAHLQRAGELLRGEDVDAAEREVDQALKLAPNDLRAKNLLGLLRFRAGRNDDAEKIYRELVAQNPEDLSLRLNLGLVQLRLGHHADAAGNLERVVEKEPQNAKAQGYYGMALMRAGDLQRAREAFVAAGQEDLVRQVTEKIAAGRAATGAGGLERLALDPATAGASPPAGRRREPLASEAGLPLPAFLSSRHLPSAAGEPFLITGDLLVARVDGRMLTRTSGALASSGRLAFAPVTKRVRGRASDEPFGDGTEAMCTASGTGVMAVSPRGGKFTVLALDSDAVYLRESAVFAFEETLHWENGRIPGGGTSAMQVLTLRGGGRVVVRSRRLPYTLTLATGELYYVDQDALLGWTGQVVPQQMRGADGEPTQFIACSGEGSLILEEPAAPAEPAPTP